MLLAHGGFDWMRSDASSKPLTKPPWPYENLHMSSDRRDDAYVKELEFDAYRRRGERDEDAEAGDEDDDEDNCCPLD